MNTIARPDPASLKITLYPAPILKRRAVDVAGVDEWVTQVIARMKAMMVEHKGVGLAAPQVGLPLRIFVMSPTGTAEDAKVLINPKLRDESGEVEGEEGCLSLPDIRTKVVRYKKITVDALDESGQPITLTLEDYPARIVQHENDHLDGVLILDRMSPLARFANRKKIKEMEQAGRK